MTEKPRKQNEFKIELGSIHGDRAIENAAVIAHEANRWYCLSMDDSSQYSWPMSPDWQKQSALAGVRQIVEHPETTPEDSHRGWWEQKIRDGWSYGEVKDPDKKLHPCMVPYAELPPMQRFKDSIFCAVVREALYCYGGRSMRDAKRTLPEYDTPVSCDDKLLTYGLVVALGRANRISEEAVKGYLAATKYPVSPELSANTEFYNMVVLCAVNPALGQAYDAYRASKFPYVLGDLPSYIQIMACTMPSFQHEQMMRQRVMWHLIWGVTSAVMYLEGITYKPRFSERYMRWVATARQMATEQQEDGVTAIAAEVTATYSDGNG